MLDRLCGLETEYAIRFHPGEPGGKRVANTELCKRLIAHIKSQMPTAAVVWPREGCFLVNGGDVHHETRGDLFDDPAFGCIEGATPECRGPRQLALYQRAQDSLLAEATRDTPITEGSVALVKNNGDAEGNLYGSHENYELTVATGWRFRLWCVGMAAFTPLVPLAVVGAITLGVAGTLLPIVGMLILIVWANSSIAAGLFLGAMLVFELSKRWPPLGRWVRTAFQTYMNACILIPYAPIVLALSLFIKFVAFRRVRREATAFLVSRPIFAGAGALDDRGRFRISARAPACRWQCSVSSELGRSMFYMGHVIKCLFHVFMGEADRYCSLFRPRQRLQITVGDSNVAPFAEYLRLGTTMLVLDAIEAGALADAPRLRRPLKTLRTLSADPTLTTTVRLADGRKMTALEIQRFYLEACRRYLQSAEDDTPEAWEILSLWEETLAALEHDRGSLVGKIDWITKWELLQRAGDGAEVAVRRKIDLRYHELSDEGYFALLEKRGLAPAIHDDEEVQLAIRTPPRRSPAAARSYYIRKFGNNSGVWICAGWHAVVVGLNGATHTFPLHEEADEELPDDGVEPGER
jgi:proteasome accessory factor A